MDLRVSCTVNPALDPGAVLAGGDKMRKASLGGVKTAAEIINLMGSALETSVLDFVRESDPDLAQKLMDNMFGFDDLIKLDDAEDFAALLKGHDIRHIFFGHAHRTISGSWNGIAFSALPSLNHQLPLVGGSVPTVYSDEPPMYAAVTLTPGMTVVHSDAFLDRRPARMHKDAERGNWY